MVKDCSLIMVKPDAIQRELVNEIETRLSGYGLQITKRKEVVIDRTIILRLWPMIFRQTTLECSFNYLGGVPLPIWLVTGPNAVELTLRVKTEMRALYCSNKLHTLFHCPDAEEDFIREYKIFFEGEQLPELS
jgi:nucleoside diphosphate kinase